MVNNFNSTVQTFKKLKTYDLELGPSLQYQTKK